MTRESDGASGKIEKLKWLCENSLEFLCKEILWKGNPPERKLWGGVHTDLEKFLGKGAARKAVLLPRNHLKSSVVTVGKTIQWLLRRPNARVLIVNQVWDRARDFLREIKEQLERSDLQHLYGPFKSYRWNEDGIIINQRRRPLREPSVMTTGVEAETTGGHFDYIILDDLMGLQNSGTPEQREKAKRFRRSMINLLEPDGQLVEIGTRWHLDDTFSEIFEKEHEYYDVMVRTIVEDGKLIFPEKFNQKFSPVAKRWVSVSEPTMDYVDYLKKSMPLSEFSAQYMNNPLDEENQIFRHEYMQWFDKRPNGLYVALTVDPAITEKVTADSTAMVVAGMDKDGKIYVLDYVEGKWASGAIIDNLFQKVDQWRPNAVGLESVGFQRTLKYAIEKEMVRRGKHFPIDELKAPTVGNGKEYRIKALEPFYRNKTIYHASWMKGKALETQLLTFPKGKHDDLIDALANQLVLLVPGHEGARQETKYMSGDWWMSQARQFNGRNKDYFHYG